jgi:hypothetical protein
MGQSSLCLPSRVAEEGGARDQGAATEKGGMQGARWSHLSSPSSSGKEATLCLGDDP